MGHAGVLAFVWVLAQVGPPVVTPPQPPAVHVDSHVELVAPPPDPQATAQMAGWSFSGIIVTLIAPTLVGWAHDIQNLPDFVRTTPPDLTYQHPAVLGMATAVRTAALALIGLAVLAWAIEAILTGSPGSPGRIVYGAALAVGSLTFWTWGIQLCNALNAAIAAPTPQSLVEANLTVPTLTQDPTQAFGPALLVIATAIVYLLLVVTMFLRIAALDVLLVLGSLALVLKANESTSRYADTYLGWAVGTLFGQTLVVVALKLSTIIGALGGGVVGTLLGLAILLLARRLPGTLSNRFVQSNGSGGVGRMAGLAVRRVVARV